MACLGEARWEGLFIARNCQISKMLELGASHLGIQHLVTSEREVKMQQDGKTGEARDKKG